ncbi:Carnitine dehydratase [Candidatus Desulfarcum epimagneticum]|uniref:Carnitine dehydratase n=1 Tax=uncultured Desulfobacteraceae bacterium TaxID=218296 RepID=A0A484HJQ9_9BACT|nr:Carnitine dehydratase [uncultured Desulfobacteraceae bacterium]
MTPNQGALSGIRVLDLSRLLPGPYCSMILADHGARVIAVEGRRFLADGFFFDTVNRNKEHMALDLKSPEGRDIFFKLAKKSDVIIEGFRPGVTTRLGIDFDAVKKVNPKAIYCSITGFGQTGPRKDRPGHDVNYLGYAGILDLIGEADRPPSIPGVQIADIAGGGMAAVNGILLALFAREKTGKGQFIDISMTDSMAAFLPAVMFFKKLTGKDPKRAEEVLSHRFACYNTYETSDHRFISIGALERRFWKTLCAHLGAPELIPLQFDEAKRIEIIDFMRKKFAEKTLAQWKSELDGVDACWGAIQTFSEVFSDPAFAGRGTIVEAETKDGKKEKTIGVPIRLSDTPGSVRTPAPAFGEHSAAILKELGYSNEDIQDLADREIV